MGFDDVLALVLDTEVVLEWLYAHEGANDLPIQALAERCEVDDQCPQDGRVVELDSAAEGQRMLRLCITCGLLSLAVEQ